ncbi:hypothetical protein [Pseudoramibacter alactolyticus]|mgnify:CR=1 FL=1|uniref:beta-sandwich lipoprotein n=1 Tax=Pseudoramibacter alactolyticus TaxID=113287 RepID=UPI00235694A6|nr:hypothetical protein [Pseudoramibacter alactolyticus]MBM6968665.1 hypothetical protein [Pseudoramibacter alactolyticus]
MKKKVLGVVLATCLLVVVFTGCSEADRVSENVSKEADNFNVVRRLAVINTVSNKPVFEMTGRMSVKTENDKLYIIVETSKGKYKKHIVGLNKATTMWVLEDINGTGVSKYQYTINYNPKMIIPYDFKNVD